MKKNIKRPTFAGTPDPTPGEGSEKLENFLGFIEELEDESTLTTEQKRAALAARGVDVGPSIDLVRERIAAMRAHQRLEAARAERSALLMRRMDHVDPADRSILARIHDLLQHLAGRQPELAGVYFRRFEEATPDDLQSLLDDLAQVQDMDAEQES